MKQNQQKKKKKEKKLSSENQDTQAKENKRGEPVKYAVVTGASSGIGLEIAKQLAKNNYNLLIVAQSQDIYDAQEIIEDEYDVYVAALRANLATFQGVEKLYHHIQSMRRPIDVIAINAGVGVSGNFTRDTNLDEELNMINLNVISVVHLAKLISWDMLKRGQGRILFTSSLAALMPVPSLTVYSATKSFILSFAEALRQELEGTGVTITTLLPGATDTDFFRRAHMEDTENDVKDDDKDDPADVAEQAYDALINGKDHVITSSAPLEREGLLSKFLPETAKSTTQTNVTSISASESKH